jgi:quercetin dioxygenase-like cupin family protein
MPVLPIRRVVTTHDDAGRAKVLFDGPAPRHINFRKGSDTTLIWVADGLPASNEGDADTSMVDIGTAVDNGAVFRIVDFSPGVEPRVHRTQSIDFAVVISGTIWMELDDGVEVVLSAGDVLVQRGTVHNWVNRGTEICRVAFVILSSKPITTTGGGLHAHG